MKLRRDVVVLMMNDDKMNDDKMNNDDEAHSKRIAFVM